MKPLHTSTKKRQQGFTLVEVLVSSLLTLMVMGMLFAVLMGTIDAWEGGTSRLKSAGDARLALDILKTDLESMVVRQTQYNQEWLVSEPIEVEGLQNSRLLFFAPSLDRKEDDDGDIVALSYRVAFQDPLTQNASIAEPIFGLYKGMTDTLVAFNYALGQPDLKTFWDGATSFPFTWGESLTPAELALDTRGFLAPNIVRFELAWWLRDLSVNPPPLVRFGPETTIRLNNTLSINGSPVIGKIESVEVNLTSITDEGMRRYSFLGGGADVLEDIIKEFGRSHTIRIPINY